MSLVKSAIGLREHSESNLVLDRILLVDNKWTEESKI